MKNKQSLTLVGHGVWIPHRPETWPLRYGELYHPVRASRYTGKWDRKGPIMEDYIIEAGTTVKINMVSRLGQIGLTEKLDEEYNYTFCFFDLAEVGQKLYHLRKEK